MRSIKIGSVSLAFAAITSIAAGAAATEREPLEKWHYNFVEVGLATDDAGSPNGAAFSYSHAFPLAPRHTGEHFGLELKLQTPPLLPNVSYRQEAGDQHVFDFYYGAKLGPIVRMNDFLSLSATGGMFAVGEVRGYNGSTEESLQLVITEGGDIDTNAAGLMTTAVAFEPKIRLTLKAFTLGFSAELYRQRRELTELRPGVHVDPPPTSVGDVDLSGLTDDPTVDSIVNRAQEELEKRVHTDGLGEARTVPGDWRTRFVFTIGVNF
jgi:hypothetical protein